MEQEQKGKILRIFPRRVKTPAPVETPTIDSGIRESQGQSLEPAEGEQKEILEKEIDEILSYRPEVFSIYHFNDFVENMIKLMGIPESKYWPEKKYTSRPLVFDTGETEGFVQFAKESEKEGYSIRTHYETYPDKKYFAGEEIQLDYYANDRAFGNDSFAEVTHYINHGSLEKQYLTSLTHENPVEVKVAYEQKNTLSAAETMMFLSKIYAAYQNRQDHGKIPTPQEQ